MPKKRATERSADKDGYIHLRIDKRLNQPVYDACDFLLMKPTEFVNQAVREKLLAMGKWPLPAVKGEEPAPDSA